MLSCIVAGAQIFENSTDVTSYSYDSAKKELVSYDTPNIIKTKVQYINAKGLAGSMFWEASHCYVHICSPTELQMIQLSTDKVGSLSLVGVSAGTLGTLDQTQNHIKWVLFGIIC
jgi:chitinase